MLVHLQEIWIPAAQSNHRVPIYWNELKGAEDCKVLSWIRAKPTWIEGNLYPNLKSHPSKASSLILLKTPDWRSTLAIYPVGTLKTSTNLIVENGIIYANLRREALDKDTIAFVVCVRGSGWEENEVVKTAVAEAQKELGGRPKASQPPGDYWEGIGICSWEMIKADKHQRAYKDLLLKLVPDDPISTYLIDDGWHDRTDDRRLKSFGPWSGLGGTMPEVIKAIRTKNKHAPPPQIGVWVTLQGYWFGIDPHSELAKKYDCKPFRLTKGGVGDVQTGPINCPPDQLGNETMWVPSPEKAKAFWVDWFTEMKSWGVDYVKVDNQAGYDCLVGDGCLEVAQAMFVNMLKAVIEVWGSIDRVINCMSHNERMLNGPGGLDFLRPHGQVVFRNSDDYNIDGPNRHTDFVHWNLYSSILHSHLSFIQDFDMFASTPADHLPTYHALLRCLSPGPTLISDMPDDTPDAELKSKVISRSPDGTLKAVKSNNGVSVLGNRWFWDNIQGHGEGPALVGAVTMPHAHGALIGAWNCRDAVHGGTAKDEIKLRDVEDALGGPLEDDYVLWSTGLSATGVQWRHVTPGWKDSLPIQLKQGEAEGIIVSRIWKVGGKRIAVLGMMDKFATLAGVTVNVTARSLNIETTYETQKLTVLDLDGAQLSFAQDDGVAYATESVEKNEAGKATTHSVVVTGKRPRSSWSTEISL